MNITELDEWQGLTADMVREWLANLDPAIMPSACIADDIIAVSELCGETPQTLLREINPRMRKGVPSAAAIVAHEASGGHWLAKSAQNGGVMRVLRWSVTDAAAKLDALDASQCLHRDSVPPSWLFWPCDAHGTKVRWPTDSEGKML